MAELDSRIARLVDALASGLKGSDAVAKFLLEPEADRVRVQLQLEVVAEPVPIDIRSAVLGAAATFAQMVEELPAHLNDPDFVYEARKTHKDWLGEVRIEPTNDGPVGFWRTNDEGLLLTAGPRVAKMVAGAGFEPATFGL